jgi:predicted nuclease of predicted toxin-antitoxin system
MKFLVDAHLPRRLVYWLREIGHDAKHTLDLPKGNRTTDREIKRISVEEQRIVVTKDADFVNSFVIHGEPYKLLLVSTGNITNKALEEIFAKNIEQIEESLLQYDFIEISQETITIHS